MKVLTYKQFEKQIADTGTLRVTGFSDMCIKTAKAYEDISMPASAMECLCLALSDCRDASDTSQSYNSICALLQAAGNTELAKEIRSRKGIAFSN